MFQPKSCSIAGIRIGNSSLGSTLIRARDSKVVNELKKLKDVKKALGVHGRWDVVAEVMVTDLKALGDVALKINGLEGMMASEALITFEEG